MRISAIAIHLFELPLAQPFVTAFGEVRTKSSILIKMSADGLVGYGEAATLGGPWYLPEYTGTSFMVLNEFLAPMLLDKDVQSPEDLSQHLSAVRGYEMAKTALETAFWHLWYQRKSTSLVHLLGGKRTHCEVGASIGIQASTDQLLKVVEQKLGEGYKRIKIKIKPGFDLDWVKAIRDKFGDIPLTVDANSSYSLKDIGIFKKMDAHNLLYIEQPLDSRDMIDHAELQRQIKTSICLDESILNAEDARKAIAIKACKVINIKPGRVGGLVESKKIHDLCLKHGIAVWCGGLMETGIGRFFNLSLTSLAGFTLPSDMPPSEVCFKSDLVKSPFRVEKGLVKIPSSMEEYQIDDKAIERATTKKTTFGKF